MEIHITQIIALLITGVGVGFASGLLGVGGCFIMVPVQFWVLKSIGVDPTIAIRIAFGTNLLVVLPTALSGSITHHLKGAVIWKAGVTLGIAGAIGAFGGGFIASHLPGKVLTMAFGITVILGAVRMLTARPPLITEEPSESLAAYILWGIPLGIVSGIIGIGGGVLMVPIMVFFLRFQMHQAVGTSTALMIFTAIGGSLSFFINGLGVQGLPPYSTGYLNWLQWVLLAGCSVPMAIVGAKVAHLLPAKQLKYIFILVMFYMGLKMIGVFAWLHLPV
ncbi:MAG: sulfite exporter TauE/SafE family protein [Deltaproteobacteria bacterium]|nr:sulfite exporter TauE/SafE family protein [Deltaproteobacteria bacterium]MBW2086133.1 sulfite exporter TauE/SafE family protein [Deltaproteobacteria bacterium]